MMKAIALTMKRTIAWRSISSEHAVAFVASLLAVTATLIFLNKGLVLAYGDAESHLNIAKRVVSSITPSLAQLGGIWLPLPHILLIPFVYFDSLWRTGIAGSIISGLAFVISSVYIFKLTRFITQNQIAAWFAAAAFMLNPNILYLQATPMTELVLIAFFMLSSYYFVRFLYEESKLYYLVYAAFFGFCASLSRYDGWALVAMEAFILLLYYRKKAWSVIEGRLILFSTLAFFGIALWLLWGFLILSDPLYFTHSEFSAKSQQQSWLARGELPSYQNLPSSLLYYTVTTMANMGTVMTIVGALGILFFLLDKNVRFRTYTLLLLAVPFAFNIVTLYMGQSVIFIPSLTPKTFSWDLFNVRYGVMMIPFLAFAAGFLLHKLSANIRYKSTLAYAFVGLLAFQTFWFYSGKAEAVSMEDGRRGLSSQIARVSDAATWFYANYDGGIVLLDDFSRIISIIKSPVRMQDIIYVGNKPYWDESLKEPEKYATWIIMQQNDAVWSSILGDPGVEARLYAYFNKVYTSDEILIFKRIKSDGDISQN